MKTTLIILSSIFLLTISSCTKDDTPEVQNTNPTVSLLTDQEETDLLFLREEEKLARDVYLYAFDKYGSNIFKNISNSEQSHMDQVLVLINQYELSDPASNDRGVFSDSVLQGLYTDLTDQCDVSLVDAFKVGATIEDLDIKDIVHFESNTIKTDLLDMYAVLVCGSRNHMRGFTNQLTSNGVVYIPQFISQAEYDAIINGEHESCN